MEPSEGLSQVELEKEVMTAQMNRVAPISSVNKLNGLNDFLSGTIPEAVSALKMIIMLIKKLRIREAEIAKPTNLNNDLLVDLKQALSDKLSTSGIQLQEITMGTQYIIPKRDYDELFSRSDTLLKQSDDRLPYSISQKLRETFLSFKQSFTYYDNNTVVIRITPEAQIRAGFNPIYRKIVVPMEEEIFDGNMNYLSDRHKATYTGRKFKLLSDRVPFSDPLGVEILGF